MDPQCGQRMFFGSRSADARRIGSASASVHGTQSGRRVSLRRPQAQVPIDGYRLNIYTGTGAAAPTTFLDFPIASIVCNQTPPAVTTPPVNPSRALWDDPANAGKVCEWIDSGTGPLAAVPLGSSYEATLQAYNAAGRGPESNRAPFSRLAPPTAAPTGLRLRRPGS